MTYTVYILYSDIHHKHYTGFTSNFEQRLLSHNKRGKDWTCKFRPWRLIFTKEFNDKIECMSFEKWLKCGAGREFVKQILH